MQRFALLTNPSMIFMRIDTPDVVLRLALYIAVAVAVIS